MRFPSLLQKSFIKRIAFLRREVLEEVLLGLVSLQHDTPLLLSAPRPSRDLEEKLVAALGGAKIGPV